jgi:hypothetical protein
MHPTCPVYLILLDLIICIMLGEEDKLWSSSVYSFLQPPIPWTLFGLIILLGTLFSNALSLCSSRYVRAQVSHPYKITGKTVVVFYILILMFLTDEKREGSGLNGKKPYPNPISS